MSDRDNTIELLRRGYDEPTRSLNFRVGFYGDWRAVFECLRIIDQYNDFNAERVVEALGRFATETPSSVDVGREGSPVLYIHHHTRLDEIAQALRDADADEVDIEGTTLRAWWD